MTAKFNEHEITRNALQFKHIKLEPGTVVVDCDHNEKGTPRQQTRTPPNTVYERDDRDN